MMDWLPSIPYAPAQEGYWSPVTSTLNWCEEDYYATKYSAEIVNTMTNGLFMYLAAKGIALCVRHNHDRIFLIAFVGYLLVGLGSFLFHATLKYPMQLVDELSMIYTTCLMFYASFSFGKSPLYSVFLAVFLASLALFITLYYHYLQDPTFHQNMYALLTTTVLLRSIYVMEVSLRPSLKENEREKKAVEAQLNGKVDGHANGAANTRVQRRELQRQDSRDIDILKTMWLMVGSGLSVFLGGFAIWTLDNAYCTTIRQWRREVGLPWGILLEGHGWWHLMTGVGAYFYIIWGIWLRHCLKGNQDDYEIIWPSMFTSLPAVVTRRKDRGNGHVYQNGVKGKQT